VKVLVVHGEIDPERAPPDELETLWQAESIEAALRRRGHVCARGVLKPDLQATVASWRGEEPDVVYNLIESAFGRSELFPLGALALEMLGRPFTGNTSTVLALCSDKLSAKRLLRALEVPTPAWATLEELEAGPARLSQEQGVIVKAVALGGGSKGLEDSSVLAPGWDARALREVILAREAQYGGEFFAESYVAGREFKIGVIPGPTWRGHEVLPVVELDFTKAMPSRPAVLTYDRTWGEVDPVDPISWSFELPAENPALNSRLEGIATRCWEELPLRGWARFDVRLDAQGNPFVVDVNPNCSLSPDAGLYACAQKAGLSYEVMIERIALAAQRGED
jgi:D-alanine-D-alanine ligase